MFLILFLFWLRDFPVIPQFLWLKLGDAFIPIEYARR